jgi:hypothetical protein
MADKLSQSLDDILKTRRSGRRAAGRRPVVKTTKTTVTTVPANGVKKNTRNKPAAKQAAVPSGPSGGASDSKIIISNLVSAHPIWPISVESANMTQPTDVMESQLKVCETILAD